MNRADFIAEMALKHEWSLGVELGVKEGKTLDRILARVPYIAMIGVDVWENKPNAAESYDKWNFGKILKQALAVQDKYPGRCTLLKMTTTDAVKHVDHCDFVFIDADHSYDGVCEDIRNWRDKCDWLIGHDIDWGSVRDAVEDSIGTYNIGPDNVWWSRSSV